MGVHLITTGLLCFVHQGVALNAMEIISWFDDGMSPQRMTFSGRPGMPQGSPASHIGLG
jgi:hypothetical protein